MCMHFISEPALRISFSTDINGETHIQCGELASTTRSINPYTGDVFTCISLLSWRPNVSQQTNFFMQTHVVKGEEGGCNGVTPMEGAACSKCHDADHVLSGCSMCAPPLTQADLKRAWWHRDLATCRIWSVSSRVGPNTTARGLLGLLCCPPCSCCLSWCTYNDKTP